MSRPFAGPFLSWRLLPVVILVICIAASTYAASYLQGIPDKEVRFSPSLEYTHEGDYSYTVTLWPSVLYDNRTVLMPDEIPYISLVHLVNVSFSYRFLSQPPVTGESHITYSVDSLLESPDGWKKPYRLVPRTDLSFTPASEITLTESFTFNITRMVELIRAIEGETKTSAATYNLRVIPEIRIEASTGSEEVREAFTPAMTIEFSFREGNVLSFEGLEHEETNTLGDYETIDTTWALYGLTFTTRNMRYASYAMIACFSTLLGYMAWLITKRPPPTLIESVKKRYGEKIVESTEPTKRIEKMTIKVKSIEDLAKISEETIKPILHQESAAEKEGLKVRRHVFYVLDADVRYEFTAEEMA